MRKLPLLRFKFIFLVILAGLLMFQLLIPAPVKAVCCMPDPESISYSRWISAPGEEACPNNPDYTCKIRRRMGSASLICESIGCVGENYFGCKPTSLDNYKINYADGCGEGNIVTVLWEELETIDCMVSDCFYTCNGLAKRSILDDQCPEYQ